MRTSHKAPFAVSATPSRARGRWLRAPVCRARRFGYSNDAAGRRTAISRSGEAFGDLSGAVDAYGYNLRSEVVSARRTKGGASVRGFDHIALEIIICEHRAADRCDTDRPAADVQLVQRLGDEPMYDSVGTARTVMKRYGRK